MLKNEQTFRNNLWWSNGCRWIWEGVLCFTSLFICGKLSQFFTFWRKLVGWGTTPLCTMFNSFTYMVCPLQFIQTFNRLSAHYLLQASWHCCNTWMLTSVKTTVLIMEWIWTHLYPTGEENRIEFLYLEQWLEVCLQHINKHHNIYFIWFSSCYNLYKFWLLSCIYSYIFDFNVYFVLFIKSQIKSLASWEYSIYICCFYRYLHGFGHCYLCCQVWKGLGQCSNLLW